MHLLAETLQPLPYRTLFGWALVSCAGLVLGYFFRRNRRRSLSAMGRFFHFGGCIIGVGLCCNEFLSRLGIVFPSVSVSVSPIWSWELTILMGMSLWLAVAFLYPPRIVHLPRRVRLLLLTIRYVVATLILLTSLRPTLQWTRQDKEPSELLVLSDVSRSMTTQDMPLGLSRYAAQMRLLTDASSVFKSLSKQGSVRFLEYGAELKPVEILSDQPADSLTAIGNALSDLTRSIQGKKVSGILLLGDGAQRTLPPRQEDPLQAARMLGELQIPIHTVTFGASQLQGTTVDLMLENLRTSPTVFVKNRAVLESSLRALGAAGRELSVQLLIEKPSPSEAGKRTLQPEGEPVIVRARSADEVIPVQVGFVPEIAGELKVGLRVTPLDGEVLLTNNEQSTYLTVLKGGIRIAFFDAPRYEQQFLRKIGESPDIQVEFIPVRKGTPGNSGFLKSDLFRPGAFDIYIIGDVPADYFGSGRARGDHLKLLQQFVENGTGLLLLGGEHGFSRGDYGRSPIAELFPIVLTSTATDAPPEITEDLKIVPTPAGLEHYIMRLDTAEKNQAAWDALPPLEGATRLGELQPLGQALATSTDGTPLIAAQTKGRGRILAFAGDSTWRWYTSGHEQEHQQFWRQVVLWLAHKENQGDESVQLTLDSRRLRLGEHLDFTCEARDKRGEPLKDVNFQIEVTNPEGAKFPLTVQPGTRDFLGKFSDTLVPGEYLMKATGTVGGKILGLGAQVRFLVYDEDLELTNPIADEVLMKDLAELTGGQHLRPEQFSSFLEKIAETGLSPEVEQIRAFSLWDNPITVVLMVVMLCLEWFYRKLRGLV